MTNTSFINLSILLKNIHTVEITIYMYFTLLSRSDPKWFVKQFDCHWLTFEGVCDSQIGNKNSSVAISNSLPIFLL